MWVPFAVLLGLFSLLVGGLAGVRIAENQAQNQSTPPAVTTPAPMPDYNTQK
jgi:hypothetical protein